MKHFGHNRSDIYTLDVAKKYILQITLSFTVVTRKRGLDGGNIHALNNIVQSWQPLQNCKYLCIDNNKGINNLINYLDTGSDSLAHKLN